MIDSFDGNEKLRQEFDSIIGQLKWERDSAIEQLRSYGVDLFEKAELERVKHGAWEEMHDRDKRPFPRECSKCHLFHILDDEVEIYRYCPNCGSKMDGKDKRNADNIGVNDG